jgi:NADPH:quinone reductase-like Zn-dependent oxidoreductase
MKAIYRTTYGSADVLELREVDKPVPKGNEVLIKVHAASVNPLDWHLLRGDPVLIRLMGYGIFKPKHSVLGADMAGTVEAVGSNVKQFNAGDDVFGSGLGAFAEYACVRAGRTALKPSNVTFEQAAAVPVAGLTAFQALRNQGQIQAGQNVLINGASGGVGTFAVQIAKQLGAHVTGVCSSKNLELVRSLGADRVIDYTKEDYWMSDQKYDLIVDNAAFQSINKPLRVLKQSGRYVGVGGTSSTLAVLVSFLSDPIIARTKGKKVVTFMANINQADLESMSYLLEAGRIVPAIGQIYSLEEVPQAIRYVESGHASGKVVISI